MPKQLTHNNFHLTNRLSINITVKCNHKFRSIIFYLNLARLSNTLINFSPEQRQVTSHYQNHSNLQSLRLLNNINKNTNNHPDKLCNHPNERFRLTQETNCSGCSACRAATAPWHGAPWGSRGRALPDWRKCRAARRSTCWRRRSSQRWVFCSSCSTWLCTVGWLRALG